MALDSNAAAARAADPHSSGKARSPALPLIAGLVAALVVLVGVGTYMRGEVRRLRDEQTAISEKNRKDALQLLRISNDLGSLAVLMRDMVAGTEPYPMEGWRAPFARLRSDLSEALALERELAPAARQPAQQARLESAVAQYWVTVDRIFEIARRGGEAEASQVVRGPLTRQHAELSSLVSQLLVVNNRMQEEAAQTNRVIFDRVRREILLLVAILFILMAAAGGWVIAANYRAFEEVRRVSAQLRALSWRTLDVQEDVQRSISRELHDDFGQIVTAIGTLLGRARRQFAPGDPLLADLDTVRGVAQETLDRIRTRSQWLHPGVLDDFGLEMALSRCVEQYERQTGIRSRFTASGPVDTIRDDYAIHLYRIAQEALGNISRHSGSRDASVRLNCASDWLELEIEDHGCGLPLDAESPAPERGMGLVSMRERAELIGGHLTLRRPPQGGLIVQLRVPAWRARLLQERTVAS